MRIAALDALNPFKTRESRHFALLFAIVYFAQGMWRLPTQTMTLVFKERGFSAADVADFFLVSTIPWVIKPVYGLLSDSLPILGWRRKSYFLIMTWLAALSALGLALLGHYSYKTLALFYALMGLGLAFTDVLTDAMMVEAGKPTGLTGAYQSVQWAAINLATLLVGVLGGSLAESRSLQAAFLVSGCFPLISFAMGALFIHEARARNEKEAARSAWASIQGALTHRPLWIVAGFIFFFNFSPSFGPAFLFYQTDVLHFSQQFIGMLSSLAALSAAFGAALYAPLSRRVHLKTTINASIGVSVLGTLAYLFYRNAASAVLIDIVFGALSMVVQLSFLDLAAKACPRNAEGTFFALLMSVHNGSVQLSTNVGGRLYDSLGYRPLILISAAATALAWLLVPFVHVDAIESQAEREKQRRLAA